MAQTPDSGLHARIAELEAENAALRVTPSARSRGLSALSAVLIVLGLVLGSVSVVTSYAKTQLSDTDAFVATFAPLATEPAVQKALATGASNAIDQAVDIPALTAQVFDGIRSLGIPPKASAALSLLEAPATQGLQSFVDSTVSDVITSDAFAEIWKQTLRASHQQIVATLSGDESSAIALGDNGAVSLQLGPILEQVKARLQHQGVGFADAIPTTNRQIVLFQDASLGQITGLYALFIGVATWLPWIALVLLAAGVLLAKRRRRALLAAAWGAGILMLLIGVGLGIGRAVLPAVVTAPALTPAAIGVAYDHVVAAAAQLTLAIGVLAAALVLVAWFTGRAAIPTAVRGAVDATAARARGDRGDAWRTAGAWVDSRHRMLLIAIAVIAAAVILLTRPLSTTVIVVTCLVALLLVIGLQFLRYPAGDAGEQPAPAA